MTQIDTDKLHAVRVKFPEVHAAILAMAEENKRLREALEMIASSGSSAETYRRIARRALGKEKA
ncbi:hypothetical protein WBP07_17810 [Novosphingobium sp. BL-8A]|uniref:hypothetical protein n=1 Tax=Novosphingobium sp. BL-8A TaxID=3127639 RepID=UPI00375722B6